MKIKYVGLKAFKTDNVAGTGLTWKQGESLPVDDLPKAARLLRHPDVWELDEEAPESLSASIPKLMAAPVAKSESDKLRDALGALGITVPKKVSLDKLRELAMSKGIDPATLGGNDKDAEADGTGDGEAQS